MKSLKQIQIYTDGACRGNPGPGGWGVLLIYNQHEKIASGADSLTTNNRMELMAAIEAFHLLKEPCQVDLYTDSQYVQKGITLWLPRWQKNNWLKSDKKPVKNADLWQALSDAIGKHQVNWHWVKGHSGDLNNDRVDAIANIAIDELKKRI